MFRIAQEKVVRNHEGKDTRIRKESTRSSHTRRCDTTQSRYRVDDVNHH